MYSAFELLKRINGTYRIAGLKALIRIILLSLSHWFYHSESYYLIVFDIERLLKYHSEQEFLPKCKNFTLKTISSNAYAVSLENEGYEFRYLVPQFNDRQYKGAIAFCIFVDKELAHIGWIACDDTSRRSLEHPPQQIDFLHGEAAGGGVMTVPKYRRQGFMQYNEYKRLEFLGQSGVKRMYGLAGVNNSAPIEASKNLESRIYGEGKYLKLLFWESWKETYFNELHQLEDG